MPRKSKKEEIYEWVIKNVKEPISIRQIAEKMGISIHTAYKWIYVLAGENKIKMKNYSTIKLILPAPLKNKKR